MNYRDLWVMKEYAWSCSRVNQLEDELEILQELIKDNPDDLWLLNELGFCCNTLDHPEQALPYLEKSVAINDQDIWSQCELAAATRCRASRKRLCRTFSKPRN